MKRPYNKPALTYAHQIQKLRERGMNIADEDLARFHLQHFNYYRLGAYWLPFEVDHGSHQFKQGTRFEDVLNLYIFDRELRLLIMDAMERIEVSVRAQWAYRLGHLHGSHAQLDAKIASNPYHWQKNIDDLTKEVNRSEETFIQHFTENYSETLPPVWAVCEVMSLGLLSRWYKNLKPKHTRQLIANTYAIDESVLESWLHHLSIIRNICAHHSRLWDRSFTLLPKAPRTKPAYLVNEFVDGRKLYNTLVILLHLMDIVSPQHHWRGRLIEHLAKHAANLPTMGFPDGWEVRPHLAETRFTQQGRAMNERDYSSLVSKVWNYAHVLRDQGISYGDYVEQITYLLFLKMDEERSGLLGEPSIIPAKYRWDQLVNKDGDALELQYRHALEQLGKEPGLIGTIFKKAQNKLTDPAKLKRIVSLIASEGPWIGIGVDVKGQIYEGLLEKNASEVKSGAGQYFTPRPVIDAIVKCVAPKIGETVCDPACGTGGFLLAAYDFMKTQTQDREKLRKLRHESFSGIDIVDEVVRLCAMNLYLHGLSNGGSPVRQGDALSAAPDKSYDVVLTNPPFGKKSSYKVVGEDGQVSTERENYEREDFKFTTSNKQFNFLQHIMTVMDSNGRAGVVLPDNVLFEAGKAGEGIRKRLLEQFNFHTLLRLPTGIWYSQGVKANVLFFDKRPASKAVQTKDLWIYDFRTNIHFTLKTNPLKGGDLDDFVKCYKVRKETERFHRFSYDELIQRDKLNLDIFWLKDDSLEDIDSLPAPNVIAAEIVENLQAALEQFTAVAEELEKVG